MTAAVRSAPSIAPTRAPWGLNDPATSRALRTLSSTMPTRSAGKPERSRERIAARAAEPLAKTPTTVTAPVSVRVSVTSSVSRIRAIGALPRQRRGAARADAHIRRDALARESEVLEACAILVGDDALDAAGRIVYGT